MKKMNNYEAPMAEVIEINVESPVLNTSGNIGGGGQGTQTTETTWTM